MGNPKLTPRDVVLDLLETMSIDQARASLAGRNDKLTRAKLEVLAQIEAGRKEEAEKAAQANQEKETARQKTLAPTSVQPCGASTSAIENLLL